MCAWIAVFLVDHWCHGLHPLEEVVDKLHGFLSGKPAGTHEPRLGPHSHGVLVSFGSVGIHLLEIDIGPIACECARSSAHLIAIVIDSILIRRRRKESGKCLLCIVIRLFGDGILI